MYKPYIEQRDALANLFDRMYDLRQAVAKNAVMRTSATTRISRKNRFDYTPDDCFRFHEAVDKRCCPPSNAYRSVRAPT